MPSITVFDYAGVQQTIQTLPVPGQATASASSPVVIASDQLTRNSSTATIASGTSVSGTCDTGDRVLAGFIMPAAWTAATLNIEVSTDSTNWVTAGLYAADSSQAGYYPSPVAGAAYAVDTSVFVAFRFVRFRSGSAAAPINQAAARTITFVTRQMF